MNSFSLDILFPILHNLETGKEAFYIREKYFSFTELKDCIIRIRKELRMSDDETPFVGIAANDDLETYASIIALWLEGKTYIPLHENMPIERCEDIIKQVEISIILDSSISTRYKDIKVISTHHLPEADNEILLPKATDDSNIAYILFTSGSTGKPKGVPISRSNIVAFVKAFRNIGYNIHETDRFLQAFDLTFDLSVMSYLIPLICGACIYTVPHDQIKYSYIAELLEEKQLTFALMVPSTIRYLQPYFDEIDLPHLKYSLFCGEALPLDLTQEWNECVPNAIIDNVYGPTENTIFCSLYRFQKDKVNKHYNGALSIGKPMSEGTMIVIDEEGNLINKGKSGELCLAGAQLTPGYWKDPTKDAEVFFEKDNIRFYKSGDLCVQDEDGDFLYIGRIDSQIKIQGFRVELGEIEYHASTYLAGKKTVAIGFDNQYGTTEIALFVEKCDENNSELLDQHLRSRLPSYMIPTHYYFINKFPLNSNGKTDKKQLRTMIL